MKGVALGLLALLTAGQLGWELAPNDMQADVWNAAQACIVLCLLGLVAILSRDADMRIACLVGALWQGMTAACSLAYLYRPWAVDPGQGQCSARLNLPLGVITGLAALVIVWRLYEKRHA